MKPTNLYLYPRQNLQILHFMASRDIINYKALSEELTGSSRKITKENTAAKYVDDIEELKDMIELWLKWKRQKYSKK